MSNQNRFYNYSLWIRIANHIGRAERVRIKRIILLLYVFGNIIDVYGKEKNGSVVASFSKSYERKITENSD